MAVPTQNSIDTKIKALIAPIAATLPPQVQETLPKIQGLTLQVLALRRYLHMGASVTEKWAWTQQRYDDFNLSYASMELRRSIEAVQAKYEEDNPGYTLKVAPTFRPVERQIQNFCASPGVKSAGDLLHKAVLIEIKSYPDPIDDRSVARFREFLKSFAFKDTDEPTVAAPGTSDHGRAQAIDFRVFKDGKEVAGISKAQVVLVWRNQGFETKLNQAVKGSVNLFKPEHLKHPDEPWHYDLRTSEETGHWSGETTSATSANC